MRGLSSAIIQGATGKPSALAEVVIEHQLRIHPTAWATLNPLLEVLKEAHA